MKMVFKLSLIMIALLTAFNVGYSQSISKVSMKPMQVIYIENTVMSTDSISPRMSKDYGLLFALIGQQRLTPGRLMAIYHTAEAPWIFDVAVEVDRAPAEPGDGIRFKHLQGGDAVVLHYKGPYEGMNAAYTQIEEWLNKNNKLKSGPSIEIYLNDPGTEKDKNNLLTDIYQLIK